MNSKMGHGGLMTDSIKSYGEGAVPMPLDPP